MCWCFLRRHAAAFVFTYLDYADLLKIVFSDLKHQRFALLRGNQFKQALEGRLSRLLGAGSMITSCFWMYCFLLYNTERLIGDLTARNGFFWVRLIDFFLWLLALSSRSCLLPSTHSGRRIKNIHNRFEGALLLANRAPVALSSNSWKLLVMSKNG
jgi:hypothetical protein